MRYQEGVEVTTAREILLKLKLARVALGLSQDDVAKMIGYDKSQFSRIEGNRAGLTLENLIKLLEVYQIKFADLDAPTQVLKINFPEPKAKNNSPKITETTEYLAWMNMQARCYNKNNAGYELYGGRGIEVCPEWRLSFSAFLQDMGAKPSEFHSLDRINVDGNYEPSNCRWATSQEQAMNRRSNLTYKQNQKEQ